MNGTVVANTNAGVREHAAPVPGMANTTALRLRRACDGKSKRFTLKLVEASMSYEGYDQYLCANGHLREFDAFTSEDRNHLCNCGASFVFLHAVDETNGIEPDNPWTIPYPFTVKTPAVVERCNLGHLHVTQEATYEIPNKATIPTRLSM